MGISPHALRHRCVIDESEVQSPTSVYFRFHFSTAHPLCHHLQNGADPVDPFLVHNVIEDVQKTF